MCGIFFYFGKDSLKTLVNHFKLISHRGPDDYVLKTIQCKDRD